ncbi:pantothenate metabolism flavoprotein [Spiroplasma sabaudiense Ar-1343]|uniref:Coenzyme A biosynthesis bifunctional protein CoaBC n=1 Tax=Spiroplasma sabaudiense Ar-1343 TaxID=1276257 RepID=W6A9S5_9MOLU|nr:bifunctional phosphopantothenoylcysteine decarboxylase/phosphopantothenate--cysteine ligase CoaBC [Spiroplasma sabaudiense]AHI53928.1 pantothenate metabolism flavoprotein [Spiroplasma sabaudiense Ar-1343]
MKKINLIVTGGIAASKSKDLYLLLKEKYEVAVILTKNAKKFVNFEGIQTHEEIFDSEFYEPHSTGQHINKTLEADLNIVYPATYNFIGKIASGIADDLATLIFAASAHKTWLFPSMNDRMYNNAVFQINKQKLSQNPLIKFFEPNYGRLASGHFGIGRALEPSDVLSALQTPILFPKLANKKVLLNFGRTRTYLDKVRYLTNESSGKMGWEIFQALENNDCWVTAVHGDCDFLVPKANNLFYASTNIKMLELMELQFEQANIVICLAALNDFQTTNPVNEKIEKRFSGKELLQVNFEPAIDVLKTLGTHKTNQFLVGFSLANSFDLQKAWHKVKEKNLDLLILNLTSAMSSENNQIKILVAKSGQVIEFDEMAKTKVAKIILKTINELI